MTDVTKQKPKSKRRWLLIGSLALNLFLITFLVVGIFRHHMSDTSMPRPMIGLTKFIQSENGADWFLRHMPDEDAEAIRSLRAQFGDTLRSATGENRSARRAVLSLIAAGERDPSILEPAFARLADARLALQETQSAMLLAASGSLSDEGYQRLAGWRRHKDK